MRSKPRWKNYRAIKRASGLLVIVLLCGLAPAFATTQRGNIFCRPNLSTERRDELASKLRAITGYAQLDFDEDGALRVEKEDFSFGSQTAREVLAAALAGRQLIVLEDASNRTDVVFCRVVEGRWLKDAASKLPAYILLVDFADFSRVTGDRAALAAFHAGWGVFHELDHVVHNSRDAKSHGEAGDCEETVNRMRRECGLPERAEYFFTFLPGLEQSAFSNKLVRLAFEQQLPATNKKKRYWLIWDARIVGGLPEHQQLAVR